MLGLDETRRMNFLALLWSASLQVYEPGSDIFRVSAFILAPRFSQDERTLP
jgi:hypothetical protein